MRSACKAVIQTLQSGLSFLLVWLPETFGVEAPALMDWTNRRLNKTQRLSDLAILDNLLRSPIGKHGVRNSVAARPAMGGVGSLRDRKSLRGVKDSGLCPTDSRAPAAAHFPLLPQCFPDTDAMGGEAKSGSSGPL
jgi:hypothetical protein